MRISSHARRRWRFDHQLRSVRYPANPASAYAASKEAIRDVNQDGAKEWGKLKSGVNTILPSAMSPKALW